MNAPRHASAWVRWIESGPAARGLAIAAVVMALGLLSFLVAYKQFHGPGSEVTFAQANLGRQLATGQGFVSQVIYPQTVAYLTAQGIADPAAGPLPDLAQPPLYPLAIAGALAVSPLAPAAMPVPPAGWAPDYALLGLNVVLLWLAALQTWRLAGTLFSPAVGAVAALGLLLSAPVWRETVAVNGTPLAMVLGLGLLQVATRFEQARSRGQSGVAWLGAAGAVCGLLYLTDYPAGIAVVAVAAFAFWRTRSARAVAVVLGAFALMILPWSVRNLALTGSPVGLAWHDVALRAGDPTAEPATLRAGLSAAAPAPELNKIANKGLSALQAAVGSRLWSGGAMVFAAFFVAGALYPFQSDKVRELRRLAVAALVLVVVTRAFLSSGEGERDPLAWMAPWLIIFGAGFFAVLVASHERLAAHFPWAAAGLLALQAVPLVQDALEPRRAHFHYPPYHAPLFVGLKAELQRRSPAEPAWLADVPAGAAWYSGLRVWAQPATLRDFYRLSVDRAFIALVLTPRTLDRPYFSELGVASDPGDSRLGDWPRVYSGLATGRLPAEFPLTQSQKLAENLQLLINPSTPPLPGK